VLMSDLQSIHAYIYDVINDMAAERVRSFGEFAETFVRAPPGLLAWRAPRCWGPLNVVLLAPPGMNAPPQVQNEDYYTVIELHEQFASGIGLTPSNFMTWLARSFGALLQVRAHPPGAGGAPTRNERARR